MGTLIKTTQDGRRVEITGIAVTLDGKLESLEIVDLVNHPRKFQVLRVAPDATHLAGRVPLTKDEAERAKAVLWENQKRAAAHPGAIAARFQASLHQRAWEQGIE